MTPDAGNNIIFSVVTPSFNQGEFLAETIESVLAQEGDFFLDYIIVDGGSSDNSVAVIKHFDTLLLSGTGPVKCKGIRYRWLSEKDQGQTDALLKGFRMARGEILAWLNSDDTYLPGALQAAADQFRATPETALCYGDAHYCDAGGAIIGSYRTAPFDFDRLAWFNFICQPSAFFRREVFEEVGGLDPGLHFAMDLDLWIRIGRRFPCRYLPRVLSSYRLHESSKTVSDRTLMQNCREAERLALKYFGWAPFTRIYNFCHALCRARLPVSSAGSKTVLVAATLACSVLRSLWLNRGFRRKDWALLSRENFRKLSKSRIEIMTKSDRTGSK
jgi:glycosyltransferase involved in cell wall biosynthesis